MPGIKRGTAIVKLAAVVSSVALVSLYLIYRTGGGGLLPSSKSGRIHPIQVDEEQTQEVVATTAPAVPPSTQPALTSPAFFPGSKSGIMITPAEVPGIAATSQPSAKP